MRGFLDEERKYILLFCHLIDYGSWSDAVSWMISCGERMIFPRGFCVNL